MTIYQKLAVAAAGVALGLAVTEATPVQAAIITYDFTFTLSSGQGSLQSSVGNEYSGSFSYDDEKIVYSEPRNYGLGYTTLPTDFSLNFNNINYTEANLIPYGRGRGGTLLQFKNTGSSFELVNFWLAASDYENSYSFNLSIFHDLISNSGSVIYSGNSGAGYGSSSKVTQACY